MVRILDLHPALGFETKTRWEVAAQQRDDYLKSIQADLNQAKHRKDPDAKILSNNLVKLCAYIPAVHIIIGLARIALAYHERTLCKYPLQQEIWTKHIIRGIAEIFFGYLLAIPDIIQTLWDEHSIQEYLNKKPA